jgi:eukaryotic-like serine/threonine-protein kinase
MPEWKVSGYTELKLLGSGGFGDVVLARHDTSGTLVAIKYLRRELLADPEFAEMFRSEATVLASLDDPNVVRLYEYIESPAGAAIVMEVIAGVSLREILRFQGKTTAEAALVVLDGSLRGLAAAHRRGVVHRDYKPENVLVNGDGISKLSDFGIAARTGDRPIPAGTLAYAAPEQISGALASPATDIYAATATFYECLTGRPPFIGDAPELLRLHRSAPVPLDPVPEPLRPLVAAGMAKEPLRRPTDATSFVTELKTAASDAYGRNWHDHGQSHLGEAALLLAALWPTGAPPTIQGTAVQRIPLRRRIKLRHVSAVKAAIAASAVIAAAAAGTALAATGSPRSTASNHPVAAVRPVSLQRSPSPPPSSSPSSSPSKSATTASPSTSAPAGASAPAPVPPTTASPRPPVPSQHATTHSAAPSPSPSTPAGPAVPVITSVGTYTQGVLVYFDIHYSDPGNDAEGFGFVGVNGSGWAEENHPFTSPSYGIVGSDSIAYPFNEACGTAQHRAAAEAVRAACAAAGQVGARSAGMLRSTFPRPVSWPQWLAGLGGLRGALLIPGCVRPAR